MVKPRKIVFRTEERSEAEQEEVVRELEAAESAKESNREVVERSIDKRFLQKQPPRKRTGRRGE
ncbi:MAG: hypothetical protein HY779_04995 [Rubrobacteridae bacterium]|nr:hypothetical protein [Rubrobacteridae bacterium]